MWQQRALVLTTKEQALSSHLVNCAQHSGRLICKVGWRWEQRQVHGSRGNLTWAQRSPQNEGYGYCWSPREMSTFQRGVNLPGSSRPASSSNILLHWLLSWPSLLLNPRALAVTTEPSDLLLRGFQSQISSLLLGLETLAEILGESYTCVSSRGVQKEMAGLLPAKLVTVVTRRASTLFWKLKQHSNA